MEAIKRKIEEADDIADVTALMINLNIPTKGCKTLQQMTDRICENLKDRRENLDPTKAFKVIADAQAMEKQKSIKLVQVYYEVLQVVGRLDATFLNLLKTSEGDVPAKIKSRMERIENKEYVVLVAGETSAGKSSMLNLILGEELLPFSVLSTTSTICELRYGEKRSIRVHYKQEGRAPEIKELDESSSYIDQISTFVHVKSASLREKAPQYKKVELFWPHSLLKQGVVIVDSPGIGESDIMDNIVVNYLPNAFAFIYVINSTLAGGVQKDRLLRLLDKTRGLSNEAQMEFSPNCALFVCNKWDNVPPNEAEAVMKHIITKLTKCLPGLDSERQIMPLSTTKALSAQKFKIMNEEFALLTQNIGLLVKKSIETRLKQHWSWLDRLLDRIIWMMSAFIENMHTDKIAARQRHQNVMDRLQKLQTEKESVMSELRDHLEIKVRDVVGELISYLKRQDVIEMFSTWDEDKLPENEGSWEVIEAGITKLIQTRLQTVIQEWEEEQQKFAEACRSVFALFFQKYSYLGKELEEIEVKVSQGQAPTSEGEEGVEDQVLKFFDKEMTLEEKILLGVMIPLLMPSGLLVTAVLIPATLLTLPVMGLKAIFENIQSHHRKTKYLKNRREFVHAQSLKYLQKVSTKEALQPLIQQQLMQVTSSLGYIERRIPMLIEADMQLCRQLLEEENRKDVEATYKPQKQDCERLRGQLALVGALEIRTMDIAWGDLDWDVSEDDSLQKALSPGIYSGRRTKNGDPSRPVNLIVYKELLTTSNVSECLETERALRNLRHPHIVQFYGATFREVPRGLEAVFLTEQCGESLKNRLVEYSGNNPADNSLTVAPAVLRWAQQIVDALIVVHSKGYVHGDLRLANVLIDSSNPLNVKLSNISLTKQLTIDYESTCDESVHLPPEAIRNMTYDTSSEIYSLGIMLWEMWYCEEAFSDLKGQSLKEFLTKVEEGHRPELQRSNTTAASKLSQLVEECWTKDAAKRRALEYCASVIKDILSS